MKFKIMSYLLLSLALVQPASANPRHQETTEQVIEVMGAEGYEMASLSRTLFGRLRFISYRDKTRRETIVNPNTGEILADYYIENYDEHRAKAESLQSQRNKDDDASGSNRNPSADTVRSGISVSGQGY